MLFLLFLIVAGLCLFLITPWNGLIHWRRVYNRADYDRTVPIGSALRREIDRYLTVGARNSDSAWLFPNPANPKLPLSYKDVNSLLTACEDVAREMVASAGLDPEDVVPDLGDQKFHAAPCSPDERCATTSVGNPI